MRFDYRKPKSLDEALEILSSADENVRILAGGTDILVNIQEGLESPRLLVDIGGLQELEEIVEVDGRIEVGALVTHARVLNSPLLRQKALPLVQGCAEIGSPQIRSRGTLGGNLANASPAADTLPPLVVLDAVVTLVSRHGDRKIRIDDFFIGVKKTTIRPEELLLKVAFPPLAAGSRGFFRKLGQRKALAIAKVSVAARIDLEEGEIMGARIALGAVATTVIRAEKTEEFLRGKTLAPEMIAEAGLRVAKESRAISDIRSTAEYRDEMAGLLLARGLEEIAEQL